MCEYVIHCIKRYRQTDRQTDRQRPWRGHRLGQQDRKGPWEREEQMKMMREDQVQLYYMGRVDV